MAEFAVALRYSVLYLAAKETGWLDETQVSVNEVQLSTSHLLRKDYCGEHVTQPDHKQPNL